MQLLRLARLSLYGYDSTTIDELLNDAHHRDAYLVFMRQVLRLLPALADDAVVALVIGDIKLDRGRPANSGIGLAESVSGARRGAGGLPPGGSPWIWRRGRGSQ